MFLKQREEIVVKRGESSRWEIKRQEIVAGGAVAVHGHLSVTRRSSRWADIGWVQCK